ncbi:MAG: SDR family oxidoreductase [Ruminococcaceae bacterium]|nr:SDR family oxidoreductase [Oscillospiraceae bacterium]
MGRLENRVAIITGAAAGIGYATAKKFLEEGAGVAICDVSEEAVQKAAQELSQYGKVKGFKVDITDRAALDEMAAAVKAEFGRIDILINNAGIVMDAQFYKMTEVQFDKVIDVNLKGTYNCCQAVIPTMMEQNYGRIVSAASVSGFNGAFGQSNYAASKAAIMGMTRCMGRELGKYGITVNAVAPGSIMTAMFAGVPEEIKQKKLKDIPVRRFGDPSEVANVYAFLASEEASYVNGTTLVVDGGKN